MKYYINMYHLAKGQFCGPGNSALGKYIAQTIISKLQIANIQIFLNLNNSKSTTEFTHIQSQPVDLRQKCRGMQKYFISKRLYFKIIFH